MKYLIHHSFLLFYNPVLATWPNATNVMRCFFTRETRISSNVAGKCDKRKLDSDIMTTIKIAIFNSYPCAPGEDKDVYRKTCIKAIDKADHQLYRKKPATATKN